MDWKGYNRLIGETVEKVFINPDKDFMRLQYNKGYIEIRAEGDCCSYSWIEHIENVEYLIGATIISVEDIDMPDLGAMSNHECVKYYGLKIVTTKGSVQLDYRNSSNGYYGGDLDIMVCQCQHVTQIDLNEVTEDF